MKGCELLTAAPVKKNRIAWECGLGDPPIGKCTSLLIYHTFNSELMILFVQSVVPTSHWKFGPQSPNFEANINVQI